METASLEFQGRQSTSVEFQIMEFFEPARSLLSRSEQKGFADKGITDEPNDSLNPSCETAASSDALT
jgi:hypothetical protein